MQCLPEQPCRWRTKSFTSSLLKPLNLFCETTESVSKMPALCLIDNIIYWYILLISKDIWNHRGKPLLFLFYPHRWQAIPLLYLYFYSVWQNTMMSIHPAWEKIFLREINMSLESIGMIWNGTDLHYQKHWHQPCTWSVTSRFVGCLLEHHNVMLWLPSADLHT